MKAAIVAGGTGGHIYPGIAIAEELKRRDASIELLFLGSNKGLELDVLSQAGYPVKLIKARKNLSAPFVSLLGFFQSLIILKSFGPKVLISCGGYASLPVVLAARMLGIRIFLHEQNVLPGAVNRFCRRFAQKVFLSFRESQKYLKGEVVGNPVRREIIEAQKETARQKLGLPADKKIILVMGGSQGSKRINEVVIASLASLPNDFIVLHVIGKRDYQNMGREDSSSYRSFSYVYAIEDLLAVSDLVVSRAGATAIAEFLVRGLPMILIPFPYAAENHQLLNAEALQQGGAAIVIKESEFNAQKFIELISRNDLDYDKMSRAGFNLAKPKAAERIVDFIYA